MKPILIWDLPVRILHWLLVLAVGVALAVGFLFDDHDAIFPLHMVCGLIAASLVALRVIWGIIGTRHARFAHFPLSPLLLLRYLRDVLRGRSVHYSGLNPGSAWAAIAMFVVIAGLALTGLRGESLKEVHEVLANVLLGVIGAHLLGILWHTVRERENIAWSMFTGRKRADASAELPSARPIAGLVVAGLAVGWIVSLFQNYDARGRTLRLPGTGTEIRLGENESERKPERRSRERRIRRED